MKASRIHSSYLLLVSTLAVLLIAPLMSIAQTSPMTLRYTTDARGNIELIGNAIVTCSGSAESFTCAEMLQQGYPSTEVPRQMIDIDGNAGTFNSSSSDLTIPANATVLFAGLYWIATDGGATTPPPNASARTTVLFDTPATSSYQTINGTLLGDTTVDDDAYGAFADVTALVAAGGSGTYTTANIQVTNGSSSTGPWGGWSLAVVYQESSQTCRNLTVFDGFENAFFDDIVVPVSGFQAPPSGPIVADIGFFMGDGDIYNIPYPIAIGPDAILFDGQPLSDALNPYDANPTVNRNFFNNNITRFGVNMANRNPNTPHNLSIDVTMIHADGILAPGSTSTTVTLDPDEGLWWPMMTTAIETTCPEPPTITKTHNDTDGEVIPGQTLTYSVTIDNPASGQVQTNVALEDILPAGLSYVPGSAQKTYWINSGTQTGSFSTDMGPLDFESTSGTTQSYTVTTADGVPAAATLTSYSFTVNGSSSDWRSDVSLTATYPDGTAYNVDRSGDSDDNEFGNSSSGPWSPVSRGPGAFGGSALGEYSFIWYDSFNEFGSLDNSVSSAVFSIDYSYPGRAQTTDAANAPPDLITSGEGITLQPGEAMTVTYSVTVDSPVPSSASNIACFSSSEEASICDTTTVTATPIDFGDVPQGYDGTVAAAGFHVVSSDLYIGSIVADDESAPQWSNDAAGDSATTDDEEGVVASSLALDEDTGGSYQAWLYLDNVSNNLATDAQLACWADFNADGDFLDAGERSEEALAFHWLGSGGAQADVFATNYYDPNAATNPVNNPGNALGDPTTNNAVASIRSNEVLVLEMGAEIQNGDSFEVHLRGNGVNTGDGTGTIEICTGSTGTGCGGTIAITEAQTTLSVVATPYTANATGQYLKITRNSGQVRIDGVVYSTLVPADCTNPGITDSTWTTGNIPAGCSGDLWVQWSGIQSLAAEGTTSYARCRLTTEDGSTTGAADFFSDASPSPTGAARDGEVEDHMITLPSTTPAVIADVRATQLEQGGAMVSWLSASEYGAAAFKLERWVETEAGQGEWQRVHQQAWIPALSELQGGEYQVFDATAEAGQSYRYRVVEQPVRGAVRAYDAHEVRVQAGTDLKMARAIEASPRWELDRIARLAEQRANRRQQGQQARLQAAGAKTQAKAAAVKTLKLTVGESGLYALSASELASGFGVSLNKVKRWQRNGRLNLSSGGEPVSWYADGEGTFYFYGEALESLYSAHRSYWLSRDSKGQVMGSLSVKVGRSVNEVFETSRHYEQDQYAYLSVSDDPESDYWSWDSMVSINGYRAKTYALPVPAAQAVAGTVSIGLWGGVDKAHVVDVSVNGEALGTVRFSGAIPYEADFELPAAVFVGEVLTMELSLRDPASGGFDSVLIDAFDVSYTRAYEADNSRLEFPASGRTTVSGFGGDEVYVVDVTDAGEPIWITGGKFKGGVYQAKLPAGDYYAATDLLSPVTISAFQPTNLKRRNNRAEYVIISSDELWSGASALAAYRSDLKSMLVDIESIYDEFSWGVANPLAIRDFISATRQWRVKPRYVVIVGDGSFDYKDLTGTGYNLVGAPLWGGANGLYASDTLLGDTDGDGRPEVAVGRITAKTEAEALAYVDKLEAYESNALELPALLLSDNADKGGHFELSSEWVGTQIAGDQISLSLQGQSLQQAREQLFGHLDDGIRLLNYMGHGGIDRVASEGLLLSGDVEGLNNLNAPVFVGLTCLINNYSAVGFDAVGEKMVLNPLGGMIASWAASGESLNGFATGLGVDFHNHYRNSNRIGDAIVRTLASEGRLVSVYTLLGDPALVNKNQ